MMPARQPPTIRLADLLPVPADCADLPVPALSADSRQLAPGAVFVALAGQRHPAPAFVRAAIAAGAGAVLLEADAPAAVERINGVPVIPVAGLRAQLGGLAGRFYGAPSEALHVSAVTGTNGKTTVTQLAARLEQALGHASGVIGTLGWGLCGDLQASGHTTPDVLRLHGMLASLRDRGAQSVFIEVSSHALDQQRIQGVRIRSAAFTNLSHDHLDYHGSLQAYADAKARLLHWPGLQQAVINADDAFGRRLLAEVPAGVKALSYGIDCPGADIEARALHGDADGLSAHLRTPWGEGLLRTRLLGRFNMSNALAVIGLLGLRGHALPTLLEAWPALAPVRGRLEPVATGSGPAVVIDYAHSPDALEQVLRTLRGHTQGRLHVVFGCGGDRDAAKRPLMGRIAERLADGLWLTSDNPRHEDPQRILADIRAGLQQPHRAALIADRAEAIAAALDAAAVEDLVLIAGKGHETSQQIGEECRPFSDHAVVAAWLRAREGRA